jgi:hypothetical protein
VIDNDLSNDAGNLLGGACWEMLLYYSDNKGSYWISRENSFESDIPYKQSLMKEFPFSEEIRLCSQGRTDRAIQSQVKLI